PGQAQHDVTDRGAPGDERHEAEREEAEHDIGAHQLVGTDADQYAEKDDAQRTGAREHPDALEVEQAEGDQITGMDVVVEGKAELLQLLIVLQTKLVPDPVADRLPEIVLEQREDAAHHAGDEQRDADGPERCLGRSAIGALRQDALRLIHGVAEQARDRQLKDAGYDGRNYRNGALPG